MNNSSDHSWSVSSESSCPIGMNDTTMKCQVCQASWIAGQLFWSTGKPGRNLDLASLCCNRLATLDPSKFEKCVNPCKGQEGGDTWEERMKFLIGGDEARKRRMEQ